MDDIVKTFGRCKLAIVGDMVADQFLYGTVNRVSREAPVFILDHDHTVTLPGGMANCAANVASLAGGSIPVGLIGDDANGQALRKKLEDSGIQTDYLATQSGFATTTKLRILAAQKNAPRQQVIRVDYQNKSEITDESLAALRQNLRSAIAEADAMILSDYGYGLVETLVDLALKQAQEKQIPVFVDSRYALAKFAGTTAATPNQDEIEAALGRGLEQTEECYQSCDALRRRLDLQALLVTLGSAGMLLLEDGKAPLRIDSVGAKEPVDVTGAGDTVIAAFALGCAAGLSFEEAARVANHAGGIVVMKRGTAVVTPEELSASLRSAPLSLSADTPK